MSLGFMYSNWRDDLEIDIMDGVMDEPLGEDRLLEAMEKDKPLLINQGVHHQPGSDCVLPEPGPSMFEDFFDKIGLQGRILTDTKRNVCLSNTQTVSIF